MGDSNPVSKFADLVQDEVHSPAKIQEYLLRTATLEVAMLRQTKYAGGKEMISRLEIYSLENKVSGHLILLRLLLRRDIVCAHHLICNSECPETLFSSEYNILLSMRDIRTTRGKQTVICTSAATATVAATGMAVFLSGLHSQGLC